MMNTQLENISKVWPTINTIFSVPHTEQEYQSLVNTLEHLIDEIGDDERA
jgi:HTH-type transcriptional regulator/antitoxin HigA